MSPVQYFFFSIPTSLALHLKQSVEETDLEEKLPSQSDSPDPEAGLQSKPGPPELDQKPQELQDGFTKLQYKGNKSHHHEEQVKSFLIIFCKKMILLFVQIKYSYGLALTRDWSWFSVFFVKK